MHGLKTNYDKTVTKFYYLAELPSNGITVNLNSFFSTRRVLVGILCVSLPALVFYTVSILILKSSGYSLREILRDPAQQLGHSSFLGFVSNIGVWLWVSSTAICVYSLVSARFRSGDRSSELVLLMGLLSLLLAIDDFFLLHERYVYQKGIFLFYAVCAIAVLARHHRKIVEIDAFSFLMAGLLLASSVLIDIKQRKIPLDYSQVQLIEEGCKFLGGAMWLFFCGQLAAYRARREFEPASGKNTNSIPRGDALGRGPRRE